jgi:hypothetical protein
MPGNPQPLGSDWQTTAGSRSPQTGTVEQVDTPVDRTQVHAKSPGQALIAHAPIDGAADHVVLLDGGEPVDAVVVGVGLVALGQQAGGFVHTEVFQGQHPEVAIEQNEFRLGRIVLDHRQGFDQANFMDGGDNLLVLASAHHSVRDAFAGHQGVERDLVGLQIKAEPDTWAGYPAPRRKAD